VVVAYVNSVTSTAVHYHRCIVVLPFACNSVLLTQIVSDVWNPSFDRRLHSEQFEAEVEHGYTKAYRCQLAKNETS